MFAPCVIGVTNQWQKRGITGGDWVNPEPIGRPFTNVIIKATILVIWLYWTWVEDTHIPFLVCSYFGPHYIALLFDVILVIHVINTLCYLFTTIFVSSCGLLCGWLWSVCSRSYGMWRWGPPPLLSPPFCQTGAMPPRLSCDLRRLVASSHYGVAPHLPRDFRVPAASSQAARRHSLTHARTSPSQVVSAIQPPYMVLGV